MFTAIQRILRVLVILVILGLVLFLLGMLWFVRGIHNASRWSEPRVSVWMEHAWSTGEQSDFDTLSQQIEDHNITDLYFHVGPISEDGTLAEDLNLPVPELEQLSTTNYAWIGQIRSKIDIDDPSIRQEIIESSQWILTQGFDGIHVNIEPVRQDDTAFLLLMQEMRAALPEDKISVAMDQWQPHDLTQLFARKIDRDISSYWTTEQTQLIAEQADQMVVMTYDTNIQDPNVYEWWVEQQTVALSRLLPNDTELFIGIPSYEEGASIYPEAENIQSGIQGYYQGLTNLRSKQKKITGIAIYSYWEMDDNEWEQLKQL